MHGKVKLNWVNSGSNLFFYTVLPPPNPQPPCPLLPLRLREDKWELRNALYRWHNGSLLWKMKRILVTTNEIWCRTAIVSSGQMDRVHSGAASLHTSKICMLHTLLAFNAVIEMKRLIKGMVLSATMLMSELLCAQPQAAATYNPWLRSVLWTWQQNILLGCVLFISDTPHFASLWLLSYVGSLFLPLSALFADTVWWHSPESFGNHLCYLQ